MWNILRTEKGLRMKQFEKWWKKHNPQRGILCDDFRRDGDIWRAALKWTLSRETIKPLLGYSEHRYVDSVAIRGELKDEIKKT